MIDKVDIIEICPENLAFQSDYVPLISFKNKEQKKAAESYILQQASIFFNKILPSKIVTQLCYSKLITEKDFKTVEINYFYENLFHDLERKPNGKLEAKIKWGITFDEKCVPLQLAWTSPTYAGYKRPDLSYKDKEGFPHRRYGTIDINGTPIFYYIHFTLQEILDVIKQIAT